MLLVELHISGKKTDKDLMMPSMLSKKWQPVKNIHFLKVMTQICKHKEHSASNVNRRQKLLSVDNKKTTKTFLLWALFCDILGKPVPESITYTTS